MYPKYIGIILINFTLLKQIMGKKKNFYILYEIVDREFESKIFLALTAAKMNWRCFLLERNFFLRNIKQFDAGIVVYKSITKSDEKIIDKCKHYNHFFICLDEEGILQWKEEFSLKIRYNNDSIKKTDQILLLNQKKKELLKKYFIVKEKQIKITGTPRIDYLTKLRKFKNFHPIIKEIKKKYGNFIFFPTSFINNPLLGKEGFFRQYEESLGGKVNIQQKKFFLGAYKICEVNHRVYIEFIKKISKKFNDKKIILRPHISESKESWFKIFKSYPNVIIDTKYPSFFYTLASLVTFQWGSTISMESFALGKVCLQLNKKIPKKLQKYDFKEHYSFIKTFYDENKAINYLFSKIKNSNEIKKIENKILKKKINTNFLNNNTNSTNKIMDIINRYKIKSYEKIPKFYFFGQTNKNYFYRIIFYLYAKSGIINLFPKNFFKGKYFILSKEYKNIHLHGFEYASRKHRNISNERIDQNLDLFNNYKKNEHNLSIKRLYNNNFIISSE